MKHEEMTVSLRTLVQLACEENAQREMAALPTPQRLKERYPDTADLTRRVLAAIKMLQKKAKKPSHRSWRTIKRVLIAAAIAVSLLFGTLMTNAAVRGVVVNTILEWTDRNLGIRFVLEGEPLSALPAAYGPHYIPEGLILDEENSYQQSDGSFFYTYTAADGSEYLDIQASIAQNGSAYLLDNEHTKFDKISFMNTTAYLGHQISVHGYESYVIVWANNGIEHYVRTSMSLSVLLEVAENIY